jgi:hypothetical protein
MSGLCDRCNERSSHLVNIAHLPELASVAHLGYRQVCAPCYDDLLAEANESDEGDDDRRQEPREPVSIKARVEGNTSHFEPFSDELMIKEISRSGVRLHTVREIDPGAILKLVIPDHDFEATALVQAVWRENGQHSIGLKLVEPSEGWDRIWRQYSDR